MPRLHFVVGCSLIAVSLTLAILSGYLRVRNAKTSTELMSAIVTLDSLHYTELRLLIIKAHPWVLADSIQQDGEQ